MKPVIMHYIDIQKYQRNNLILAPTGNLGIPRHSMPQIDKAHRPAFIDWIKSQGIKVRDIRVPARSLKMVQGEYDRDKAGSIIDSGNIGVDPIFISSDGYVVDGNHRLIAKLNMPNEKSSYMAVTELGMEIRPLLAKIHEFPSVRYRNLNGK